MFDTVKHNIRTPFYVNMLHIWFSFLNNNVHTVEDVLNEEILYNPTFTIGLKPIQPWTNNLNDFHKSKVLDIWNHRDKSLKPKREIELQYNIIIPDITYYQIRGAILETYNKCLKTYKNDALTSHTNIPKICQNNISKIKSAQVYSYNSAKSYRSPKSQDKWIEYYPFLESINWKSIYLLPHKVVLDTYLVTFQFKIIHRIFPCNYKLFIWNINDSPCCDLCGKTDNLEHHLYYCSDTDRFWTQVKQWLNNIFELKLDFTVLEVLFGLVNMEQKYWYMVNYIIIIGKYFIYRSRKNGSHIVFTNFQNYLKWKLKLEQGVFISQGRIGIFKARLGLLYDLL